MKTTVLYDGDCGICSAFARLLERWDGRGLLAVVPLQAPGVLDEYGIPFDRATEALHVITPEGGIFVAGQGVRAIVLRLPWVWPLAWFWRVPGFGWLVERLYHLVGRNRYRLSGWLGLQATCTTPARARA